jgi:hypothetical protein
MPQKGFKKDDRLRGRMEKISSKVFPFFPELKSTFIENRAQKKARSAAGSGINHHPHQAYGGYLRMLSFFHPQ